MKRQRARATGKRVEPIGSSRPTSAARKPTLHIPVLLHEMLMALAPRSGETYIDATFGAGGYARAVLAAADCRIIAIDRDPAAVALGKALIAERSDDKLTIIGGRFSDLDRLASGAGTDRVDGVVMDIGVSSMQLDRAERGFSFMADGPLDMRMSGDGPSAADFVGDLTETELADIIYRFGEEPASRRIAKAIVRARAETAISTTAQLARIVAGSVGGRGPAGRHPATRTFQALRIAVNDELGELERALRAAERILAPGGRLVVVTFHSLEDRIVKRFLTERTGTTAGGSRHMPGETVPKRAASFRFVNHRSATSSAEESRINPRARSARLRSVERTEAPAWPDGAAE